jgi:hypothetical protein
MECEGKRREKVKRLVTMIKVFEGLGAYALITSVWSERV